MNLSREIKNLAIWLQGEVDKHSHADVSTIIKIHDGRITLIERIVSDKVKPTGTGRCNHECI